MKRRDFIKKSALGLGALIMMPSLLTGEKLSTGDNIFDSDADFYLSVEKRLLALWDSLGKVQVNDSPGEFQMICTSGIKKELTLPFHKMKIMKSILFNGPGYKTSYPELPGGFYVEGLKHKLQLQGREGIIQTIDYMEKNRGVIEYYGNEVIEFIDGVVGGNFEYKSRIRLKLL